jgi:hypothetical protein
MKKILRIILKPVQIMLAVFFIPIDMLFAWLYEDETFRVD